MHFILTFYSITQCKFLQKTYKNNHYLCIMRTEILYIKFLNLKTKRPKKEYIAYINANQYKKTLEQWNNENTKDLFNNKITIHEISVKMHPKIKENQIVVINNKLLNKCIHQLN